jgi:hypothetical protein
MTDDKMLDRVRKLLSEGGAGRFGGMRPRRSPLRQLS